MLLDCHYFLMKSHNTGLRHKGDSISQAFPKIKHDLSLSFFLLGKIVPGLEPRTLKFYRKQN